MSKTTNEHAGGLVDPKLEKLCNVILKKSNENWEEKNKAIQEMTVLLLPLYCIVYYRSSPS